MIEFTRFFLAQWWFCSLLSNFKKKMSDSNDDESDELHEDEESSEEEQTSESNDEDEIPAGKKRHQVIVKSRVTAHPTSKSFRKYRGKILACCDCSTPLGLSAVHVLSFSFLSFIRSFIIIVLFVSFGQCMKHL